jgi:crossover junction endodeoxyribonuclease RuvC
MICSLQKRWHMRVCGIDGGVRGGLAIISIENGTAPALIACIDIPVAGTGAKERVDPIAIRDWVLAHRPDLAFIERAQAMPGQGASSGFKYGRSVGAIEAAIMLADVPLTIVEPSAWKKFHSLRGKDKEGARLRTLMLFPTAAGMFARKKDHGKAEAALIALFDRGDTDWTGRAAVHPSRSDQRLRPEKAEACPRG